MQKVYGAINVRVQTITIFFFKQQSAHGFSGDTPVTGIGGEQNLLLG